MAVNNDVVVYITETFICTILNILNLGTLPTQSIYVFCTDFKTNSDCFSTHQQPYCVCKEDREFTVRGNLFLWCLNWYQASQTCHRSGSQSPFSHREGPGSILAQIIRNSWWTKRQWDRFFSEYFGFHLSLLFHQCYIYIFISAPFLS